MNTVDAVEILVIVDNATDSLSSNPRFVETEFAGRLRRGMRQLGGACLCCAAHGLSCLVTARRDGQSQTVLFDTGPDGWVFERNAVRLGVDFGSIDAMVLSHGHWDHAGAMPQALQMINVANGGRAVPTYMHPGMFVTRALKMPDGRMMPVEDVPGVELLGANGARVISTVEEQVILDGSFYISGEIPRVTAYERGLPGQHRLNAEGAWEPDELVMDERFVALNVADKGLFVFTACSHAGLINVLTAARARFPGVPLFGVMGGFHLAGATELIIPQTVEDLAGFNLKVIVAAHCTGWRAISALAARFGAALVNCAVGKRLML
jgi:7,8-dihydropterin-6-yl-methyl-4-(beta-D-ribofuranosyl)aminobenzene 5'-phosphate synthase